MEMIRIAIPIFHHSVSPVLDTCNRLLIIDYEKKTEVDRREIAFDIYSQSQRFEIIKKINPDTVICCGISDAFDRMLQAANIKLVCGIVGDVQQVAEAFLCNRLDAPCFKMPGLKADDGQ
jgi:predicted Fe-Mo cluster-binding NifX family protein